MRIVILSAMMLLATGSRALAVVEISMHVFGGGGGFTSSASHGIRSTLGQPVVGSSSSIATTVLMHGFWHGRVAVVNDVTDDPMGLPTVFRIYQNAPNPFGPRTALAYDVPRAGEHVRIQVFDLAGRLVRTLVDGNQTAGHKSVVWDGRDDAGLPMTSGTYFCRFEAPGCHRNLKMTRLR